MPVAGRMLPLGVVHGIPEVGDLGARQGLGKSRCCRCRDLLQGGMGRIEGEGEEEVGVGVGVKEGEGEGEEEVGMGTREGEGVKERGEGWR